MSDRDEGPETGTDEPPRAVAASDPSDGADALAPTPATRPDVLRLAARAGTDTLLAADQGQRIQPMEGFEDTYVDPIDYIVRITHRIWEDKDVGYIYDTYRHNSRVIDDSGLQYGRDKIVADTLHTLNAFPDARLYADEVIWTGDDQTGFKTSHRTVIVGHNTGPSRYGPATGRRVVVWAVANCVALRNEIFEEHVLYNRSSMLAQLGFDLREVARELGDEMEQDPLGERRFGEAERLRGQGKPDRSPALPDGPFAPEPFVRRLFHELLGWRNLSSIDAAYAPNVRWLGPTGRVLQGRGDLKSFWLGLLATFPDLAVTVDDIYHLGDEASGYDVAVRWSGVGTHRGHGAYGRPTGRRVAVWGISQLHIADGRITQEWMLFNELDVLAQILRTEPLGG